MATAFDLDSETKTSTILDANYVAEHKIKNGILDQVVVSETYLYVPFSVGKKGAQASVRTKLKFAGTSKETIASKCSQSKTIIFENPLPVVSEQLNAEQITRLVERYVSEGGPDSATALPDATAGKFLNLARIVRAAKKTELLTVYDRIKASPKNALRKTFLDLLFDAHTEDAVEIILELLRTAELTPSEERHAYSSFFFARQVGSASITTATVSLLIS